MKLVSEVADDATPSMLVDVTAADGCTTVDSYSGCDSTLYHVASGAVSVFFLSDALGLVSPSWGGLS